MKFGKYLSISKYTRICIWFMMMLQLISTLNETENRFVYKFAAIEKKKQMYTIFEGKIKKYKKYLLNKISF